MRYARRKHNRHTLLFALLLVALVGMLLPARITGKFINLVQVIAPFQDWAGRSADSAGAVVSPSDPAPSAKDWQRLQRENAALRHQLAALSGNFEQLERDFAAAAGIRRLGLSGGKLIPARVVAEDALPWRESRLVNAGLLSGIRRGSAVASNLFTIAPERADAVAPGKMVLSGEVLVGFVEQVGTHTARVRMLTDRQTQLKVTIARYRDGVFHPLDAEFYLVGTGGRQLEVRDVDHRYIRNESIQVGDSVITVAGSRHLPVALTVGEIKAITPDPDNSLLYRLTVDPPVAGDDLRSVFVIDVSGADD
jgi:cell shape-determining protein MreC